MGLKVGVHVSIAGSIEMSVQRAQERGCDCYQIFTKNPRAWKAKAIDEQGAESFKKKLDMSGMGPVFAHMPYLPNFASDSPEIYEKSVHALKEELLRCEQLGIPYLVTHLGHARDDPENGRIRVIEAIRQALDEQESHVMLLLENTAGEKNSVGSRLEDIAYVLEMVDSDKRVGVCFDTCHGFAAGYDQRSIETVNHLWEDFSSLIGLSSLHMIHLNDAKGDLGSGLDRHEHIGLGSIGMEGMHALLHHPAVFSVPLICETPVDDRRGDEDNIRVVREIAEESE